MNVLWLEDFVVINILMFICIVDLMEILGLFLVVRDNNM